jgi:monothiol glutaredoxin
MSPFSIYKGDAQSGSGSTEGRDVQAELAQLVSDNEVVLFMKGTPDMPQCGFSMRAVQLVQHYAKDYTAVNVLADPSIREGVKEFSNWPTIPQLYVSGEFIGGSDILMEMHENGELESLFSK